MIARALVDRTKSSDFMSSQKRARNTTYDRRAPNTSSVCERQFSRSTEFGLVRMGIEESSSCDGAAPRPDLGTWGLKWRREGRNSPGTSEVAPVADVAFRKGLFGLAVVAILEMAVKRRQGSAEQIRKIFAMCAAHPVRVVAVFCHVTKNVDESFRLRNLRVEVGRSEKRRYNEGVPENLGRG